MGALQPLQGQESATGLQQGNQSINQSIDQSIHQAVDRLIYQLLEPNTITFLINVSILPYILVDNT